MKGWLRRPRGRLCATAGTVALAAVAAGLALTSGGSSAAGARNAGTLQVTRARVGRITAPDQPAPLRFAHPAPSANIAQAGSYGWSGYADTSSTTGEFSAVSGSWTVPAVTCTSEDRQVSEWVGLDGFSNQTVEQDGTEAGCFEGKAVYQSWYEMYPAAAVYVSQAVKPGDKISASVKRSGTTYTLTLTDSTTSGNNISHTATCAATTCLDRSAEWIGERPAYTTTGDLPLAQFNTPLSFTSASETAGGKTGTISTGPTPEQVFMLDSTDSYDLAVPSSLNSAGNAFTDAWKNSY